MKKIECYETEDGRLFTTYEEALMHEKEEEIKSDLRSILNASIITGDLMKKMLEKTNFVTILLTHKSLKNSW